MDIWTKHLGKGWSSEGPGAGLSDAYGSFPIKDILWFNNQSNILRACFHCELHTSVYFYISLPITCNSFTFMVYDAIWK